MGTGLTEKQEEFLKFLLKKGIERENIIVVCLLIRTDERIDAMLDFLSQNGNATMSDIMRVSVDIAKKFPDNSELGKYEHFHDKDFWRRLTK